MSQTGQMKTLLLGWGTRVIFVWFGELPLAFFIVSPCKQTVAMEKMHTLSGISLKFHFRIANLYKKKELEMKEQYLWQLQ